MRWKRKIFWVHRWLGLVVGLQLLVWSVSGFTFTILDIDDVHGDFERSFAPAPAVRVDRVALSPAEVLKAIPDRASQVARMGLRERLGRTVYELFDGSGVPLGAVDASSGEVMETITEQEAVAVARADFTGDAEVASVALLEGEPPLEFRGRMPVYQVIFDHPKETRLYISPVTGNVLKRRNNPWRKFDWFWMLHIMDYRQRTDFNHWLLTGMSVLAILTSASGLGLWIWRIPRRRKPASTPARSVLP